MFLTSKYFFMNKIKQTILLCLVMISCLVHAQVKTNFNSKDLISNDGKFGRPYKTTVNYELPAQNIAELLKAENDAFAKDSGPKPYKFAIAVPVDFDISKQMEWNTDNNFAYGKYTIKLGGASSSSINFDKFYLPKGSEMYVYNGNGQMITGAITEAENNPRKVWGSWVYKGEFLTIEIKTPAATKDQLLLHSNNIAYGYKKFYETQDNLFGDSAPCEINVVCALGTGWENERNAVALVLADDGTSTFSGAMVMNSCGTNTPYFLTANHCYINKFGVTQNVSLWRFTFHYWSPTCFPSQDGSGITYNGAELKANWSGSDFCLVKLNNIPSAGITYAGWSRLTTGITQTTILHHPKGDVMKITRDVNPPVFATFNHASTWKLNITNTTLYGTTENYSSGGPYFNQDHKIIGQHAGSDQSQNNDPCSEPIKYGGRFDLSWDGPTGGNNSTQRLKDWLDPSNSGTMTTITTDVAGLHAPPTSLSITGALSFCSGNSQYDAHPPASTAVTWAFTCNPAGIATASVNGNILTINATGTGTCTLNASAPNCSDPDHPLVAQQITVQVGGDPINVTATKNSCDEYQFNVTGAATGASYSWSSVNGTVLYNGTSTTATTSVPYITGNTTSYDAAAVNTTNSCQQSQTVYVALQDDYARQINGIYEVYSNGDQVNGYVNTTAYDTYYRWYINGVLDSEGSDLSTFSTSSGQGHDIACGENTIRVEVTACSNTVSSDPVTFYKMGNCFYGKQVSSNVVLFPNPATYQTTIKLSNINGVSKKLNDISSVRILDKLGNVKSVIQYPKNSRTVTLNLSKLPLDVYYIEVSDGVNKVILPLNVKR
jgi:lysyl endopeptidase